MKVKLYEYPACSTCKKAIKFLNEAGVPYEKMNIVEVPPRKEELEAMLHYQNSNLKKLFNTSGQLYREMEVSSKIDTMSTETALELLEMHGKLIKRPFLLTDTFGLVGFKEEDWKKAFSLS